MRTRLVGAVAGLLVLSMSVPSHAENRNKANLPKQVRLTSQEVPLKTAPSRPLVLDEDAPGVSAGLADGVGCDEGCGVGGCDVDCGDCVPCEPCGPRWAFFGEFLYLRARDAEVVYAVPSNLARDVNDPYDVPVQVGPTGVLDYDYEPAFRVGFNRYIDPCATVGVAYTKYESSSESSVSTNAPFVVRSMVAHPFTRSTTSDGLDATANGRIRFDLADMDYRRVFIRSESSSVNYVAGIRYAFLEQGFGSRFAVNGEETVTTGITFEGGGFRLGLEGERYRCGNSGLMLYAKGIASFMFGEFSASYVQQQAFAEANVVDTGWEAGRVVPILELELGIGWTSCNQRWRLTGGYLLNAWYNVAKTADFIEAVQSNSFTGLNDKLTFDGLRIAAEYRF